MKFHLSTLLAAALAAVPATAADLVLKQTGGGAGQLTTMALSGGEAGKPYLLLFAAFEQVTPINANVTLDIPLTFAGLAAQIPGFTGLFNGAGAASASFVIPNDPAILGLTIPFQALGGYAPSQGSNLVRLTPAAPGTFENTLSAPALPIAGGAVVHQADGSLLLLGGSGPVSQTYDPAREEFALAGASFGVGILGQSTTLADGRILFTGGLGTDGLPTAAAAVYDPATDLTTTLAMNLPRAGHGASLMNNGKVLITGGFQAFDLTDLLTFLTGVQASTELFDPATDTFTAGPTMLEPRALHTSTSMSNGQVLIAGGLSIIPIVNIPTISSTAYAYTPGGSFGLPKFMSGGRLGHSAVALPNGKVLLVGGLTIDFTNVIATGDLTQLVIGTLTDCQLFTPGLFGSFATVNALSEGRAGAGVIALADGGALIAGGFTVAIDATTQTFAFNPLTSADRFTVAGNVLAPTGALGAARLAPVLTSAGDGTILVLGGGATTAEVYQP